MDKLLASLILAAAMTGCALEGSPETTADEEPTVDPQAAKAEEAKPNPPPVTVVEVGATPLLKTRH